MLALPCAALCTYVPHESRGQHNGQYKHTMVQRESVKGMMDGRVGGWEIDEEVDDGL